MPPRSTELAKLPEPNDDWSRLFPQVLQLEERVTNMYAERPEVDFSSWYTPTFFRTTDAHGLYRKFMQSASQLIMDRDPDLREDTLKKILDPKLAGTVFSAQLDAVCHDIAVVTGFCEDFVRIGATLPDEVRQYCAGDPKRELFLVKKLILVGNIPPKESEIIPDLVFGQALIAVSDQQEEMSVPEGLLELLKAGKYDAEIARDLLEDPEVLDDPRNLPEIKRLLQYTQSLMGIPSEAIDPAIDLMLEEKNMEVWPESAKKELAIFKLGLASELQSAIARLRTLSYEESVLTPLAPAPVDREAALDRAIQKMRDNTVQQEIRGSKLELVKAVVASRAAHKRPRQRFQATKEGLPLLPPEVKKQEPFKLAWLDQTGISHPENSDAWRRHFRAYLKTYGNGNENFYQDVNNIIEYLRTLDFSKGYPPGVKPYGNDYMGSTVYELKPAYAPDQTRTQEADSIRILFLLEGQNLEIIGMARKDKLRELNRNLGLKHGKK